MLFVAVRMPTVLDLSTGHVLFFEIQSFHRCFSFRPPRILLPVWRERPPCSEAGFVQRN